MSNFEKRIENLLQKLRVAESSTLFAKGDDLDYNTEKKLAKSRYEKDKVLLNLYREFKKSGGKVKKLKTKVVINTPFVQEKWVTQRGDMLYTIDGPMQLIHVDLADLNFFSKSAVAPKYCLLCVDLFTSKVHTYGMKKKRQLADKPEKFYQDIEHLRSYLKKERRYRLRLQTDQKFNQNEIKNLNKKHDVEHYNTKLNEGHAVAAKQKIRKLKIRLKTFKRLNKATKNTLKPNKALKKAILNMNIQSTRKYSVPTNVVEKKSLESEEYKLAYDLTRIKKVDKDAERYGRYDRKKVKNSKKVARIKKEFSARKNNFLSLNDSKITKVQNSTEYTNLIVERKQMVDF